jgi:hypothetical protein
MVTALIIVIAIALVSLLLNIILNCKLKNERADNSYELQKIEKQYTSNISDVVDKYGKIVAEKDNLIKDKESLLATLLSELPKHCGSCGRFAGNEPEIWEGKPQCERCAKVRKQNEQATFNYENNIE